LKTLSKEFDSTRFFMPLEEHRNAERQPIVGRVFIYKIQNFKSVSLEHYSGNGPWADSKLSFFKLGSSKYIDILRG
jgi:hypothetical protein